MKEVKPIVTMILIFMEISLMISGCKKIENKITDPDGNVYTSVTIGTQTWMVENLKTTKYNDGTTIQFVTDDTEWLNSTEGAFCWYNNSNANKDLYGGLYNWYVIDNNPASSNKSNGGKNVCPVGWHVPSQTDWTTLVSYLMANGYNYDGIIDNYNKVAKSLAISTGWDTSTVTGAVGNNDYPLVRNKTGFTAIPAGKRNLGFPETFIDIGKGSYCWQTTTFGDEGIGFFIYFDSYFTNFFYTNKQVGFSVKCIKD